LHVVASTPVIAKGVSVIDKWPSTLYLIRHGQSERNVRKDKAKAEGRETVWSEGIRDQDTPLTTLGNLQALSVGVELRKHHHLGIDTIFTSPYLRARQTTTKLCEGLGSYNTPEIVVEERIRELEFGILDGLTPEGVRVKYPEEVARRKKEGKYYYRPPGGENRPDLNLRIHSFIDTLNRDFVGKTVAVSCHSVVVLAFRHLLERWDEEHYLVVDKEDVKNASVTTYKCISNKIRLHSYNEVFYTETPE
jgi:broad specificity phosphatase PhoE